MADVQFLNMRNSRTAGRNSTCCTSISSISDLLAIKYVKTDIWDLDTDIWLFAQI